MYGSETLAIDVSSSSINVASVTVSAMTHGLMAALATFCETGIAAVAALIYGSSDICNRTVSFTIGCRKGRDDAL